MHLPVFRLWKITPWLTTLLHVKLLLRVIDIEKQHRSRAGTTRLPLRFGSHRDVAPSSLIYPMSSRTHSAKNGMDEHLSAIIQKTSETLKRCWLILLAPSVVVQL